MDEMKLRLSTKLMRGLIAKFIAKSVRKKFGCDIDIQLNELDVTVINGKMRLHTSVDVELNNDELMNIVKSINAD